MFSDTHAKMQALQIRLLRQAAPYQKLEMLCGLNASARMLSLIGLRARYPQDSDERIQRRLANLLLGEELANKVYGDSPDVT